jgi:hypothetical protein
VVDTIVDVDIAKSNTTAKKTPLPMATNDAFKRTTTHQLSQGHNLLNLLASLQRQIRLPLLLCQHPQLTTLQFLLGLLRALSVHRCTSRLHLRLLLPQSSLGAPQCSHLLGESGVTVGDVY